MDVCSSLSDSDSNSEESVSKQQVKEVKESVDRGKAADIQV